ncbi:MAG: AAA family ATPase [Gallionella sp.]|nr:AAA family ATPase [Gallionella sp.]
MKTFHSADLLATPPKPIQYIVDGLLPLGGGGDTSGMPDSGKSTILLSMAAAISTGAPWYGLKTAQTPTAWITGEASGSDAIQRDLHRLKVKESDILFFLPDDVLFRWVDDQWITTANGRAVIDRIRELSIGFMVMDTIGSLVAGLKEVDNDQQRQLARHLRDELHGLTFQTISHTNQASARDELSWRLHYLSRAGGNGFPGFGRWAAGVSRLQCHRPINAALEKNEGEAFGISGNDVKAKKLVAFGVSKNNEAPPAVWTHQHPAIFEIRRDGGLVLVVDGRDEKNVEEARHDIPPY